MNWLFIHSLTEDILAASKLWQGWVKLLNRARVGFFVNIVSTPLDEYQGT